ncbi:TonB-dependent receptor [Sphingomonas corticis]|jgi:uncharacterized membrane protein YgcG|uniref:TonB-dependent receptor n=1 Tax=Sphingomonas corticis TaxID=2722791 RepID=A0ABX1CLT9_9SPHN|nr:TonB-dependent receptor [Sphingomonas corticis]NJR77816.1 TonB-dependent receptor [Sphingomonas corticis]
MRALGLLLLTGTAASPALAQQAEPAAAQAPAAAAGAQQEPEPDEAEGGGSGGAAENAAAEDEAAELVVTGARLPGSVPGDITPEQQLSPADIRSYGVNSVSELLTELAPQTRSGRGAGGPPVVLVNGRRISGFQEIRDLPTEAIQRVDILPEEVALKFGYRADQRVVNFVLRRRFRAATVELDHRVATDGGRQQPEAEVDLLRIQGASRTNLHVEYTQAGRLTEAERGVRQQATDFSVPGNVVGADGAEVAPGLGSVVGVPAAAATRPPVLADFTPGASVTDQSRFRTLLPETRTFAANGTYATSVFGNVAFSVNATVDHNRTEADRGLATTSLALPTGNPYSPFAGPVTVARAFDGPGALVQRGESTDLHLGSTLNGDAGRWRWTVTGTADRSSSDTVTQTGLDATPFQARLVAGDAAANPFGPLDLARLPDNIGRSRSTNLSLNSLASGPLFALPAGDANASIRIGASTSDFSSFSSRASGEQSASIARDIAGTRINLDLPIARRNVALSAIGNFSLNGNIEIERLSDFGTLVTLGYGANWSPLVGVRFLASVTDEENAPGASQLGNPVVLTPGVRVFDYVTGTTATVTTVSGGNPGLEAEERHVTKLGLDLKPWSSREINLIANYVTSRTDGAIAGFPTASAAIETAFPDRFERVNGTLVRLDSRPINYARTERSELRYGINLSFPLKSAIQKQLEAFRAGTGPNPFAGLRPPGGRQRPATQPDGSAAPGAPPPPGDVPPPSSGEEPRRSGGPGGSGPGGGRGFGGGGRGGGGGRVQFALYHTWHLSDRVLIADGGPLLDLLDGDAVGSNGGQPRHELEGQAGYANNGLGARLSVNFRSATRVNGGTVDAPETLSFGSLATADLRLFADLGQRLDWVRAHPWLRGTRVSVGVTNLFNQRQRVTDRTGEVPIGFQPAYLDALGRTVRVSVRKIFF